MKFIPVDVDECVLTVLQPMNRPYTDDIDPMVPELPATSYAADGGVDVTTASDSLDDTEVEAPLVPDLS